MQRKFRQLKNYVLLLLGYVLVNQHHHTVYLRGLQQIRSNYNRRYLPYSLDDRSWQVLCHKSALRNLP